MKRILPPTLLLICLLVMGALHFLWPLAQLLTSPVNLLGSVPLLVGLALAMIGSNHFSTVGTNINTFNDPDKLVTDGLFKYSRNPMYLGMVLVVIGVWLLMGTATPLLPALGFIVAADRWYIPFEERRMAQKFGMAFAEYKRRTRRWL